MSDEITRKVIDTLESNGIPYMLVGAFSSNYYGVPRSTKDADFVVEFKGVSVGDLVKQLGPEFRLDLQMRFETVTGTSRHVIEVLNSTFLVEMFHLSQDPHDLERFRRRVRVEMEGGWTTLPTAEDVIVTKLRWALLGKRPKDSDDARDVIAVQGDAIDWEYVYRWCDEHGTREKLEEIRKSIPPL